MYRNSKVLGDVGVGQAIAHFTKLGHTVSIPLSDSQDYDLIVDIEGDLKKVQIKTGSSLSADNTPIISLRTLGGNQSWGGVIKRVIDTQVDFLFCCHLTAGNYLIPKDELVARSTLVLNETKERYKIS
jgi:hypothetical protein